ncbi:hypothetical protein [Streptomyces lushanensis]|uniref:hypothetical protein n=1 Tax=Streptomyces lushanensis TaxID=1434255 RepID=UPI00316AD24D
MAEEFLDHDEFDALFQERGVEVPGEGGSLDWRTVMPGEDVPARLPACPRRGVFLTLPGSVLFEGAQARRQGDAPLRALRLDRQSVQAAGVGALEGCVGCRQFGRPG